MNPENAPAPEQAQQFDIFLRGLLSSVTDDESPNPAAAPATATSAIGR